MKLLRLLSITVIMCSLALSAMEKPKQEEDEQEAMKGVCLEGGSNTQLQMGRYLSQTNPEVIAWLWQMAPVSLKTCGDYCCGRSVSFSPDGRYLASGSWNKTIHIWDVQSNKCLKTLTGHTDLVSSVCWSPDGKTLASGAWDNTIRLWDVGTDSCVKILNGHAGCFSVAWSPDGRKLASGLYDGTIRIWDVESGACSKILTGHKDVVSSVAWHLDGKTLASASWDKTIKIWDIESEVCHTLTGYTSCVRAVSWSPVGSKIVSGSDDKAVRIFDIEPLTCLKTLTGHTGFVRSVSWSSDNSKIATVSDDENIRIWDVSTLCSLELAINSLSIAQQNFIISLFHINRRFHPPFLPHPLVIVLGTHARATYETLPICLKQLLLQNNCVQLSLPRTQSVVRFVQNHGQVLAQASLAGVLALAYLNS